MEVLGFRADGPACDAVGTFATFAVAGAVVVVIVVIVMVAVVIGGEDDHNYNDNGNVEDARRDEAVDVRLMSRLVLKLKLKSTSSPW